MLGGYMLDTLFMDGLFTDLERVSHVNKIIAKAGTERVVGLRPLHTLLIVPKEDVRAIAARHAHELPRAVRLLLKRARRDEQERHAARELSAVRVGLHARADRDGLSRRDLMEDELRTFLFDQPMDTLYAPAHLKFALER